MREPDSYLTSGKKPKIVLINQHGCGRSLKQALVMTSRGWDMTWLSGLYLGKNKLFQRQVLYQNPKELEDALDLFDDSYVFIVANEPSWMVTVVKTKYPEARIIFDVHDSNYWRTGEGESSWYEEDVASRMCDAYVFPSESAMKSFPSEDKPMIWLPSANPRAFYYYGAWNYSGGIVSQGGHIDPKKSHKGNAWRDYTEMYMEFRGKKKVFAYSAEFTNDNKELNSYYESLGCTLGRFTHEVMIEHVGSHDWGLVGNVNKAPVWDVALPNKFYDYIAGGVPSINFNCPEVAKIIDEYDIGINVKSVDEAIERWEEHKEKRFNLFRVRDSLSLENYIQRLESLIEEVE